MNQNSKISAERVKRVVQNRFNPIRNLTPEYLGRALDAFERGELKVAAQLWETIERRDDKLKCVIPKRKKAVGRYGWNIVMDEEGERAEKHKQALEHFFKNSVATDAVRGNYCRGWSGLVRQMLDALGKGYAIHELIWKPSPDGLTAEFKFAPLWFFENRTGKLRFLPEENSRDGEDLEDGEWMVTVEDGLMEASSIAYMFKILPLRDWLIFCEKFGIPPVIGKTNASQDSKEWETMVNAVGNFMNDWAAVISLNSEIEFPQVGGSGDRPFAPLVDRIDRVLASMWRGGDLSSMSATAQDAGQGASVQGDESDLLEEDDAETICETLNKQVVPWVIKYALGDDTPLARLDIPLPSRSDNNSELQVDKAFKEMGIPQAVTDIRERYGRRTPDDKDEVIGGSSEDEKPKPKTPITISPIPIIALKGISLLDTFLNVSSKAGTGHHLKFASFSLVVPTVYLTCHFPL
mgnify:CR=1 FL=1